MESTQEKLIEQNNNVENLEDKCKVQKENNRLAGIDLFRILSMFMVVIHHVLLHGGVLSGASNNINFFVAAFLESVCLIAVNCFALTTGFLNADKKIKIKNILNLYLQVLSFSVFIALGYFILKKEPITFGKLLKYFLPIASGWYWYFSAYFLVFLFMPLLNVILNNANKKFLLVVLVGAILFFGVYYFLGSYKFGDSFKLAYGFSALWLMVLYLLGGIIKKLDIASKAKSYVWILAYFGSVVLSFCTLVFMQKIKGSGVGFISNYCFLFNVSSAILLMLFFARIKLKSNKFISFIAKASFGVYLLHDNELIRSCAINSRFVFLSNYNFVVMVLAIIGVSMVIYIVGTIVEIIRQYVFKFTWINKLVDVIDKKIVSIYNKIKIKE